MWCSQPRYILRGTQDACDGWLFIKKVKKKSSPFAITLYIVFICLVLNNKYHLDSLAGMQEHMDGETTQALLF